MAISYKEQVKNQSLLGFGNGDAQQKQYKVKTKKGKDIHITYETAYALSELKARYPNAEITEVKNARNKNISDKGFTQSQKRLQKY